MATADVITAVAIADNLGSSLNLGRDLICTDKIDTTRATSSPVSVSPKVASRDRFILNSDAFFDLQVYLKVAMRLPNTAERFRAVYPEEIFSTYLRKDTKTPPLYKALEQTLVEISKHCTAFSSDTMQPMISLAGYIANFATTATDRSAELAELFDSLHKHDTIDTNDPSIKQTIDVIVALCSELSDEANSVKAECKGYVQALSAFKVETENHKANLEEVNARSQAVLPTTKDLNEGLRKEMEAVTNELNQLAKEQNKQRAVASGRRGFYLDSLNGCPILFPHFTKIFAQELLKTYEKSYQVTRQFAEDKLLLTVTFREKSANLMRSIQTVLDTIQKAIDALQHMMGAFSKLETDVKAVATKLDQVSGYVAKGNTSMLKIALKRFDEGSRSWAKVVDLAEQFQANGSGFDIDPEKLGDEESEFWQHLEILSANYGACDYTDLSKILFNDGENLRIRSVEPGFPDPWDAMPKSISILHQYKNEKRIFVCKQDTGIHKLKVGDIELSCDRSSICRVIGPCTKPSDSSVEILAIVYGLGEVRDQKVYDYCYSQLKKKEPIHWTNENFGGDTWVGHAKAGTIYYTKDRGLTVQQCTGRENNKTYWEV